ncbi:MAG: OmpH family outer membrane protein [Chitinophagaceae bacterium]
MSKFFIGLNVLLVIAVGILYYLYFDYTSRDMHKIQEANAAVANSFKIAYFDLDSLQEQYDDYKDALKYLRGKDSEMSEQLNQMKSVYINKVKEYNEKGPSMSQTEQLAFQQQLAKMDNDYQQKQQDMNQEMQAEGMRKLQEVKTKIQDFLKTYCKEKGYAYVFGANDNDYLYYKDTLRNITADMVHLLNAQHPNTNKK